MCFWLPFQILAWYVELANWLNSPGDLLLLRAVLAELVIKTVRRKKSKLCQDYFEKNFDGSMYEDS